MIMRTNYLIIIIVCVSLIYSCDTDELSESNSKQVCTKWGASVEDVEELMGSCNDWINEINTTTTQVFHYNEEFLDNHAWTNYHVISYEFTLGNLSSSTAIVSSESGDINKVVKRYLSGYSYLGGSNSVQVYADENNDTMAIVYEVTKGQNKYFAIGWTSLGSSQQ